MTAVLEPLLGFPGVSDTGPLPVSVSGLDVPALLRLGYGPRYVKLRDATTPMPQGAFNVVQVHGGRIEYQWKPTVESGSARAWTNQLANQPLEAFVVAGAFGADGFRMLPEIARTNGGFLVVYTRWQVFDDPGQSKPVNVGFYYRQLRFEILDDDPAKGDVLRLRLARPGGRGYLFDGDPATHLAFLNEPDLWLDLIHAARDGYDRECRLGTPANP